MNWALLLAVRIELELAIWKIIAITIIKLRETKKKARPINKNLYSKEKEDEPSIAIDFLICMVERACVCLFEWVSSPLRNWNGTVTEVINKSIAIYDAVVAAANNIESKRKKSPQEINEAAPTANNSNNNAMAR